jgi:Pseudomonas avirulence D protein (AvrD)
MRRAVGAMMVQVELTHALSPGAAAIGEYARIEDLLGDGDRRYYGNGYKQRSQIVRDVEVDEENRWARADVRVALDDSGDEAANGLDAHHQPTASMIDFLTPLAQLGQILLYRTDRLDRGSSNTLWLRRVVMTASTPRLPMHADVLLQVSKNRVVDLDGRAWRIMDATDDVPGLQTWFSCAHELPTALA